MQTVKDYEVILVDSGSTDRTIEIAKSHSVKVFSITREEFSFGRSLNLGCRQCKGEFIVILSAHTYPIYPNFLEELLKPFQDPKVGLVYGRQKGNETTKYSEHQVFAKWFPEISNLQQKQPFCNNANAAVRKTFWEEMPYNEHLMGLEDLDWAKRLLEKGYHLAYNADAEIVHVHEETPYQIYNRYCREAIAMQEIIPDQKFIFFDFCRLWVTNILSDYKHAWQEKVLLKNGFDILRFRFLQFWGTYRGFSQGGAVTKTLRQTYYYPRSKIKPASNGTKQLQPINYQEIAEKFN